MFAPTFPGFGRSEKGGIPYSQVGTPTDTQRTPGHSVGARRLRLCFPLWSSATLASELWTLTATDYVNLRYFGRSF